MLNMSYRSSASLSACAGVFLRVSKIFACCVKLSFEVTTRARIFNLVSVDTSGKVRLKMAMHIEP